MKFVGFKTIFKFRKRLMIAAGFCLIAGVLFLWGADRAVAAARGRIFSAPELIPPQFGGDNLYDPQGRYYGDNDYQDNTDGKRDLLGNCFVFKNVGGKEYSLYAVGRLKQPSATAFLADTAIVEAGQIRAPFSLWAGREAMDNAAIHAIHSEQANFGFADGHVAAKIRRRCGTARKNSVSTTA